MIECQLSPKKTFAKLLAMMFIPAFTRNSMTSDISISYFKTTNTGLQRYHKLRKIFGKFFRSYSDLLAKFGEISFQEYVTEGKNLKRISSRRAFK